MTESARIVGFEVKPFRYLFVILFFHSLVSLFYILSSMVVHSCMMIVNNFCECSVRHDYEGEWNEKKTRLTTCDPHAKRTVTSSESPQEVEDKKEIIFTYDVEFQVGDVAYS